ncbi:hypothetical protein [Bradyrhizobium sp. BR 10261]|uniref:hypothetical protein n=1 Tax=Bradyrhizobium sp. BR 10261 TaxID=2749992 RepID=UPI001C647C3B|nr:hypothetical protein [Bradyrhizobium sp. BR 10261]MBW7965291.1 hypothetical protein [Bradyrhizobium sp. BR 10261]
MRFEKEGARIGFDVRYRTQIRSVAGTDPRVAPVANEVAGSSLGLKPTGLLSPAIRLNRRTGTNMFKKILKCNLDFKKIPKSIFA